MPSLKEILNQLEQGFFMVPEIQRPFVWRNHQVCELFSSIYNGYPIGSIVCWNIPTEVLEDESLKDLFRPLADDLSLKNGRYLIIDGQQRLTSLLLVKRGKITINGRERKIELYFNPLEKRLELGRKDIKENPKFFNVTEILNCEDIIELIENQAEKFHNNSINNKAIRSGLEKFRENFNTYELPIIPTILHTKDNFLSLFEEISYIFVKLNSTGTKIKLPDLTLALLTGKTRKEVGSSFKENFGKILQRLKERGFSKDESLLQPVLIRLYLAMATGTTRFSEAKQKLEKMSGKEIIRFIDEMEEVISRTLDVLKDLGLNNIEFFQSRYILVPIAYYIYKDIISVGSIVSEDTKDELARWIILASFEKRYTGRLETDLSEDIEKINEGRGISGLIENLRLKELSFDQLSNEYEKAHLTLLLLLYKKLGTKDWNLKEIKSIKRIDELDQRKKREKLHVHHIFYSNLLRKLGMEEEVDKFGNITLISSTANESIGSRIPRDYFLTLRKIHPELLKNHFIPCDDKLWEIDNYKQFLEKRVEFIKKAVEEKFNIRVI